MSRRRLKIPSALVTTLSVVACSSDPVPAVHDGSVSTRETFTTCEQTDNTPTGLSSFACNVSCDPTTTDCYYTSGQQADCNISPWPDGGVYVYC